MVELIDESMADEPYLAIAAGGLRLVFFRVDSLWEHVLILGDPPAGRVAARAIDATNHSADPRHVTSPTYQEIRLERDGDAATALLVGQGSHHHFAATFRLSCDDAQMVWLDIDIAARGTKPMPDPRPLACAYIVELPQNTIEDASHKLVRWACAAPPGRLVLHAGDSAPSSTILIIGEAGPSATLAQPVTRLAQETNTQRCRYGWNWEPAAVGPSR